MIDDFIHTSNHFINYQKFCIHFADFDDIQLEWSSEDKGDKILIEDQTLLSYVGLSKVHNIIRTTDPIPQESANMLDKLRGRNTWQ